MMIRNLSDAVRNIGAAFGDLLWPPVCAACVRALPFNENNGPSAHYCPECLQTIEPLPEDGCPRCGRPFYLGPSHTCGDCLINPPPWNTATAAVIYGGAAARSIALLKYGGKLNQLAPLISMTRANTGQQFRISEGREREHDFIIPMPISEARLKERTFNQAAELARALYGFDNPLINEKILTRCSDGKAHQAGLTKKERAKAVKGCFSVPHPEPLTGAAVLLFDDVLTTGATAGEAATTLLNAGARRVDVVTIARTVLACWR